LAHEDLTEQQHSAPGAERADGTRDPAQPASVVTELTELAERDRTAWLRVIPELARIARRGDGADRAVETLGSLDDDAAFAALVGLAREPDSSAVPGFAVLAALLISPRWPAHRDEGVPVLLAALRRGAPDAELGAGGLFRLSNGWAALRAVLAEPGLHPVVVRSMGWTDDRTALGRLLERLATAPAPETVLESGRSGVVRERSLDIRRKDVDTEGHDPSHFESFCQGAGLKKQPRAFLVRFRQTNDAEVRALKLGRDLIIPSSSAVDVLLRHPRLDVLNHHWQPVAQRTGNRPARLAAPGDEDLHAGRVPSVTAPMPSMSLDGSGSSGLACYGPS
jgi:hypothetical protein